MKRKDYLELIKRYHRNHPIVAILGPRQCGKTTLAKMYRDLNEDFDEINYFDLENPSDRERLKTPKLALFPLKGLIIVDEIQLSSDLFPLLRYLVDQKEKDQKFLILGSASKELINHSSETLAGRIAYIELTPFSYYETKELQKLWIRGGFPKAYLAETVEDSFEWLEFFISTFLEKDIPNLGIKIPANTLRRFWTMLAHYHGQNFNAAELGKSFGVTGNTIRSYLDILVGTFMVRELQPWHENLKKRQVKSPKLYFKDTGILHTLLRIKNSDLLFTNPKLGASWEGFALEQIIRKFKIPNHDCFFWNTYSGAELDLMIFLDNKRIGFEFKYSDAPKLTKSMKISKEDLFLDLLYVIYPGQTSYLLAENIMVIGLKDLLDKKKII